MALSKKAAKEIASLVNSIMVSEAMGAAAKAKGDKADTTMWRVASYARMIELADKYGIELPGLPAVREALPRQKVYYYKVRTERWNSR